MVKKYQGGTGRSGSGRRREEADAIEETVGQSREDGDERRDSSASAGRGSGSGKVGKKRRGLKRSETDDHVITRLKSSDDLLGRRMQGLVGGLTGLSSDQK